MIVTIVRALLAALLLGLAALVAERMAAWYRRPRRWIWMGAMVCAALLPLIAAFAPAAMPSFGIEPRHDVRIARSAGAPPPAMISRMGSQSAGVSLGVPSRRLDGAFVLWALASMSVSAGFGVLLLRLHAQSARGVPARIDGVDVRVTKASGPAVVGYVRPTIVIPQWVIDATPDERRLVVAHEREHIAGGDQWAIALGAALLAAVPWNPVLWWQHRRLLLAIETDCDARVLAGGADRAMYGRTLISAAGGRRFGAMLTPAWGQRSAQLEYRIRAITAGVPRARFLRAMPLAIIVAVLVAIACDATAPDPERVGSRLGTPSIDQERASQFFGLWGWGYLRVKGYEQEHLRARVIVSGIGARVLRSEGVVVSRESDTIVTVMTPAVLRVEGASHYNVVAEAVAKGTQVEIEGTAPKAFAGARAASARGPRPMLNFTQSTEVSLRPNRAPNRAPAPRRSAAAESADKVLQARIRAMPRGEIVVESATGMPVKIRFVLDGVSLTSSDASFHPVAGLSAGPGLSATTPARFRIDRATFFARFVTDDSTDVIRVRAIGHANLPFVNAEATHAGAVDVCASPAGSNIGGAPRTLSVVPGPCPP